MGKYRKKPVVIEAIQLTEENIDAIMIFCGDKIKSHPLTGIVIETVEGGMLAKKGDYILKNDKGLCPMREDLFKQIYEQVNE